MKIYVANFDEFTDEEDLRVLFRKYGEVINIYLYRNRFTDRPLGYALLEMPDDHQAERAIRHLNARVWNRRRLEVRERQPNGRRYSDYRNSY